MQAIYTDGQCLENYLSIILKLKITHQSLTKSLSKNYNKNSCQGYIFQVDIKYPNNLHHLHIDLPFLTERMKVKKCNRLA